MCKATSMLWPRVLYCVLLQEYCTSNPECHRNRLWVSNLWTLVSIDDFTVLL